MLHADAQTDKYARAFEAVCSTMSICARTCLTRMIAYACSLVTVRSRVSAACVICVYDKNCIVQGLPCSVERITAIALSLSLIPALYFAQPCQLCLRRQLVSALILPVVMSDVEPSQL